MTTTQSRDKKQAKIDEKVKRYGASLDVAYGKTPVLKKDSEDIRDIKETILSGEITYVDFRIISTDCNIRREVKRDEGFGKLKKSIKKNGLLQSLVVEFFQKNEEEYSLVCVSGHRRLQALKDLLDEGFFEDEEDFDIPVQVISKKIGDRDSATEIALSENVHRKNLHFLEVAETYKKLIDEGKDIEELTLLFERDSRTIKRYLKMASWSEKVRDLILEHPEAFPFKYIWETFVKVSKNDKRIAAMLANRLKKFQSDLSNSVKNKAQKSKTSLAKERRLLKITEFYSQNKIPEDHKKSIEKLLEHLNLI